MDDNLDYNNINIGVFYTCLMYKNNWAWDHRAIRLFIIIIILILTLFIIINLNLNRQHTYKLL